MQDTNEMRSNATAINRKESVTSTGTEPKTFEIEISNPFFTGPNQIVLADLT